MSKLQTLQGHSCSVHSVAFSPGDGALLASGSNDKTIILWNAKNHFQQMQTLKGHSGWVFSVAFSPGDGAVLASGSYDKTIILWNAKNNFQQMQTLKGHSHWVRSIAFSPGDGAVLASGSFDNKIILWNAKNNFQQMQTLKGHSYSVLSVTFSPGDGAVLASGSKDNTIILWDAKNHFQQMQTLKGHRDHVNSVAFSPGDGAVLASGSGDDTIILWDAKNHFQKMQTLKGHSSDVWSVAFSPGDGAVLASGSNDNTIILWDAKNHFQQMQTLKGHSNRVISVAFSPGDGAVLASGSDNETIILWDVREYIKPPIPAFFATLNEAETSQLSNYQLLDRLSSDVTDIIELKLYYTLASVSYKAGQITETQRNDFVIKVLKAVPTKFKFDKDDFISIAVENILRKAQKDGILDKYNCNRLVSQVKTAAIKEAIFADVRFTSLVERLSKLEVRMDSAEANIGRLDQKIDAVREYAQRIDKKLCDFKRQYKKSLDRQAAVSLVSSVIGIVTLGIGSAVISAIGNNVEAAFANAMNTIVDYSDLTETFGALKNFDETTKMLFEVEVSDKTKNMLGVVEELQGNPLDDWAEKPLEDAVEDSKPSDLPAKAMMKLCVLLNASVQPSKSLFKASLPLPPLPPTQSDLGDEVETFAKLKKFLDLGEDVQEVSVDDDLMFAFQGLFKINFNKLGPDIEKSCRRLVDPSSRGKIKLLHWRVFYQTWLQSGQSMAEYLKSESA